MTEAYTSRFLYAPEASATRGKPLNLRTNLSTHFHVFNFISNYWRFQAEEAAYASDILYL